MKWVLPLEPPGKPYLSAGFLCDFRQSCGETWTCPERVGGRQSGVIYAEGQGVSGDCAGGDSS